MKSQLLITSVFFVLAFHSEFTQGHIRFGKNDRDRDDNNYSPFTTAGKSYFGNKANIYRDRFLSSASVSRAIPAGRNGGLLPYPLSYRQGLMSSSLLEDDMQRYRYASVHIPSKPSFGFQRNEVDKRGVDLGNIWAYWPFNISPSTNIQNTPENPVSEDADDPWGTEHEEDRYLFY